MRVLVTGGAGYIGSHTVQALSARGHEPVVVDDLTTGHRESVPEARLIVADCGDPEAMGPILREERPDAVIHFAALKSVEESVADPARYFDHNVAKTITLLEAMDRAGVRRFVYSSSAAVYGVPDKLPVGEDAPLRPLNPYGESKRIVETMLDWIGRAGRIDYAALRYFNAAGAADDGSRGEDWSAATNLIPLVMKAALGAGPAVRVFGTDYPTPDGTAVRDYIHVADLAEAHVRAVETLVAGEHSLVLNLGTGRGASVAEVIAATARVAGRDVPVEYGPRRPGDMPAIWADSSRAERILGWRAARDLDDIVSSAWRWHSRSVPAGVR
ncbi:MAG: UDP-glucose 4-epimerase GalE [Chloroflexota bacterium]